MKYKILTVPPFDKQLKRLCKKYKSLKNEIIVLGKSLIENPIQGEPLGNKCYKIRLACFQRWDTLKIIFNNII